MTGVSGPNSSAFPVDVGEGWNAIQMAQAAIDDNVVTHSQIDRVTDYSTVLARIDRSIQTSKALIIAQPDSWLHQESLAKTYLRRARLSGEFDDYVAAQSALQAAFSLAADGAGPFLTRARLNYSLHRLPAVEPDLERAASVLLIDTATAAEISGLRADVLFHTAQYAEALDAYEVIDKSTPNVRSAVRLAHYYSHVGEYPTAERWFTTASQRAPQNASHLRAWLMLQRGILDLERGRLTDALAQYQKALEVFPGFWLIEEHVAEIDALQGRKRDANAAYRNLIKRTGSPMFMTALASILSESDIHSEREEAARWMTRATRRYARMMEQIPEAMSGHALEHFLQSGEADVSLQLARENHRLRPGGQPALRLVQAYMAAGLLSDATLLMKTLLLSPFCSAELHATAGLLWRAAMQDELADRQDALAIAMNPHALSNVSWLRDKLADQGLASSAR